MSAIVLFFFLIFGWSVSSQHVREPPQFPNLLNIAELAARGGYKVTNYEVISEDGYSLWLFRLGKNNGHPVIIQHGFFVTPDSWIIRGNYKDLPFILLELGYDVWLPALRGTVFNEYSLKYNKTDPRFWDFTFHEYGLYDMPAFIDTVLQVRNRRQLSYIGHSVGTTLFLVMCSLRPEYNAKIRVAMLLSPVVYGVPRDEISPFLRIAVDNQDYILNNFRRNNVFDTMPRNERVINFMRSFCTGDATTKTLCLDITGLGSGENRVNLPDFESFVTYYGGGAALYTLAHLAQVIKTGEFKRYDRGPAENLKRYGTTIPPEYNIKFVTAPVALFWGVNDALTARTSVQKVASGLGNLLLVKAVPDPKFNHIDMYIGENAYIVLYPDIVDILRKFNKEEKEIPSSYDEKVHSYGKGHYPLDKPKTDSYDKVVTQSYDNDGSHLLVKEEPHSYGKVEPHSYGKEEPHYYDKKTSSYGEEGPHSYGKEEPHSYGKDESHSYGKEEKSYGKEGTNSNSKEVSHPYGDEGAYPFDVRIETLSYIVNGSHSFLKGSDTGDLSSRKEFRRFHN